MMGSALEKQCIELDLLTGMYCMLKKIHETIACSAEILILMIVYVKCSSHFRLRTLVYPWLIRSGQPFPLAVPLMVFSFCTYNGFLQTRYILGHAYYPESWVTSPQFIFGNFTFVNVCNRIITALILVF
jgi:hypothetical protein